MKLASTQLVWKKPLAFWSAFSLPLASTVAGCLLDTPHWYYFVFSLACAFIVSLTLVASLLTGQIEDRLGSLSKAEQPTRYWIQVAVWIGMLLCAAAFPLAIALSVRLS